MNPVRIIGILLIAAGVAGLALGGFSYTKDTTAAKIGGLELQVKEKQDVGIPKWLSIGAVVLGVAALALGGRKP